MHKYHFVALDVAPKRAMLAEAESELAVVTERLNEARAKLQGVEDKLNDLAQKQKTSEAKREALQKEVQVTEVKLGRAGRLIDGLAGEKVFPFAAFGARGGGGWGSAEDGSGGLWCWGSWSAVEGRGPPPPRDALEQKKG